MAMTVEEAQAALDAAEKAVQDAKGKGVSAAIAASKALAAAKKELTAAKKGVSTAGKTRAQVLEEQRTVDMAKEATTRATTDTPAYTGAPASETIKGFDITQRPEGRIENGFIIYYSWVGGATTGSWQPYRAPVTAENMEKYGSRVFGGSTQAEFGTSSQGANALDKQPLLLKDPYGNIIGYQLGDKQLSYSGFTDGNNTGKTEVSRTTNPDGSITITYSDGTTSVIPAPGGNTGYKVVDGVLTFNGQPFTGTYNGQTYENGKVKVVTDGSGNTNTGYQTVNGILQFNGQPFTGTFAGTVYENGVKKVTTAAVTATNTLTATQQDVMSIVLDRLNRYNLGSLAPLIKKLAIEGASEATIMLRLQDEPLYQERFRANQDRIKKGISVLTPSEYLNLEDSYRQILRAYGLNQFDNDQYVTQFISNDVSPAELSNRVVTAVQRVRNADPAVSSMLKNYYGIGQNDLVAYVLDPNQQFQKIERQIAASEIGVAAGRQGFNVGVPVAEQLAAQGITQAEAQRGYATIADILPTAEKLSDIYGTTLDRYGLAEGEQEMFNQLASAQRKRQRLVSREVAEFSGQAGVGRGSLGTATGGQY